MQNQYYNPDIRILLCRFRQVFIRQEWRKELLWARDFWRLYYHPDDDILVEYRRNPVPIQKRKLVLIPPNTPFIPIMTRNFKQFYIHFLSGEPYDRCRPGVYEFEPDDPARMLLAELCSEAEKEDKPPSKAFSIRLEALCGLALSRIPETLLEPSPPDKAVFKARSYMDEHFKEVLTNRKIAVVSGMATNSFLRLFHQKTGLTPQQYLRDRRIQQAAILLRYSEKTIPEIAEACGFSTRYHFSRIFKHLRGYAPAEFRKLDFSTTI